MAFIVGAAAFCFPQQARQMKKMCEEMANDNCAIHLFEDDISDSGWTQLSSAKSQLSNGKQKLATDD